VIKWRCYCDEIVEIMVVIIVVLMVIACEMFYIKMWCCVAINIFVMLWNMV
jgi:hypothetical protein